MTLLEQQRLLQATRNAFEALQRATFVGVSYHNFISGTVPLAAVALPKYLRVVHLAESPPLKRIVSGLACERTIQSCLLCGDSPIRVLPIAILCFRSSAETFDKSLLSCHIIIRLKVVLLLILIVIFEFQMRQV